MTIHPLMKAVLKALSYPDLNVKKHYKLQRRLDQLKTMPLPKPSPYKAWDHFVACGDHQVPVRIFTLPKAAQSTVLLFFHGGGWVTGNIDSYDKICAYMTRITGCLIVSVDYRLAPEHPFPAGLEDCYAVAREIYRDPRLLGTSRQDITLIGDSAGANLAAALSLLARDRGEFLPSRQILIYPATASRHDETSPFPSIRENGTDYLLTSKRICDYMDLYAASPKDRQSPYFAPLLAGDFSRQPSTLIITAEYDPLRDEGEAYGEMLSRFGVEVEIHRIPDALHGFLALPPSFAPVKKTYEYINRFLKR